MLASLDLSAAFDTKPETRSIILLIITVRSEQVYLVEWVDDNAVSADLFGSD